MTAPLPPVAAPVAPPWAAFTTTVAVVTPAPTAMVCALPLQLLKTMGKLEEVANELEELLLAALQALNVGLVTRIPTAIRAIHPVGSQFTCIGLPC